MDRYPVILTSFFGLAEDLPAEGTLGVLGVGLDGKLVLGPRFQVVHDQLRLRATGRKKRQRVQYWFDAFNNQLFKQIHAYQDLSRNCCVNLC